MCWIAVSYAIHPLIEELLLPIGTEPTAFQNSDSKVARLQEYATTFSYEITNDEKKYFDGNFVNDSGNM